MKTFFFFFLLQVILFNVKSFTQEEVVDNYLFLFGQINVPSSVAIDYEMQAMGAYWEIDFEDQYFPISYNNDLQTALASLTGSTQPYPYFQGDNAWKGFIFPWISAPYANTDNIGYGFYKVTNSHNGFYFYIDIRDCKYRGPTNFISGCYNPDFFIRYDYSENFFGWRRPSTIPGNYWVPISNGEILRVWEIKNNGIAPTTKDFEDFWDNALVITVNISSFPRVVWAPYQNDNYTTSGYYVYRAVNYSTTPPALNQFTLVATTGNTKYDWTDYDFSVGGPLKAHYFVKAILVPTEGGSSTTSSPTNTVTSSVGLYKDNLERIEMVDSYSLNQNYPNPFNPSTIINYAVKDVGLVSIKVYDILGAEVATLVNETKEAGNFAVEFNVANLRSGVYIYTLQVNGFTSSKKMLLMK